MDAAADMLVALAPSWSAAVVLLSYLAATGAIFPDSSRLYYRCNVLLSLLLHLGLSALGVYMGWMTPTVVVGRGLELLSATFIFSVIDNKGKGCMSVLWRSAGHSDFR